MIRLETVDGLPLVAVSGEVDLSNSGSLDEAIELLDAEAVVVLSLEHCTFIDGTVLNVLIRRHVELDGNLIVVLPEASVLQRIFEITRLGETLRLVPDRRAALELAASLRDLGAVYFSRDGVLNGPP